MITVMMIIGSRANYSSAKPIMRVFRDCVDVDLHTICNASAVSEKYGDVASLVEKDGFIVSERQATLVEDGGLSAMPKTVAHSMLLLTNSISNVCPDFIFTIGDRYETYATAIAASLTNTPLIHTMGGEITGTIDESTRHAISKMANIHFVATDKSKQNLLKMGEKPDTIFNVGCPRIDEIKNILDGETNTSHLQNYIDNNGVGENIDLKNSFLLVSQHSVTTEFEQSKVAIEQTLLAISELNIQTICLWPNSDAGSNEISSVIRRFREDGLLPKVKFFKNFPMEIYVRLMDETSCLVGNSSSGLRDGAFVGTPVVNIGTRQQFREKGPNVIDCDNSCAEIKNSISAQLKHGKYERSHLYGRGNASVKILDVLLGEPQIDLQKRLTYV